MNALIVVNQISS